jgi:hypothetical protein
VFSVDVISKVKSDTARPYPTSLGVPFIVSLLRVWKKVYKNSRTRLAASSNIRRTILF